MSNKKVYRFKILFWGAGIGFLWGLTSLFILFSEIGINLIQKLPQALRFVVALPILIVDKIIPLGVWQMLVLHPDKVDGGGLIGAFAEVNNAFWAGVGTIFVKGSYLIAYIFGSLLSGIILGLIICLPFYIIKNYGKNVR